MSKEEKKYLPATYVPRHRYIEISELTGCIFRCEESTNFENPYQFTGDCKIAGVTYFINGWTMRTRYGKPYISLRFKKKFQPNPTKYNNFKLQTVVERPKYQPLDDMEAIENRKKKLERDGK